MANNKIHDKKHFDIYLVTCLVTGKMYVGLTSIGTARRWGKEHIGAALSGGSQTVLARTIRKYGKDAFTVEVIDTARAFAEAKSKEVAKIAELGTLAPNGLNSTPGGEGLTTCIPEVIEKIRASVNALWEDENYRRKHKESMKKAVNKDSYRNNRRKASEDMWSRAEYRNAQQKAFEESADKRSDSAVRMWESEEYRKKQSTPDRAEKGRRNALKRWHPEEWQKLYGGH